MTIMFGTTSCLLNCVSRCPQNSPRHNIRTYSNTQSPESSWWPL